MLEFPVQNIYEYQYFNLLYDRCVGSLQNGDSISKEQQSSSI